MKTPASLDEDGLHQCNGLLAPQRASMFLDTIDQRYRNLAQRCWQPSRYQPTASSFGVEDLWTEDNLRIELLTTIRSSCRELINAVLGGTAVCSVHHSWIRRQYAPDNCPLGCAPHSWHQDGALRFDFLAHGNGPFAPDALLNMVTCWIPLTPCGDQAPGLELVTQRQPGLLPPVELTEPRVRERFAPDTFWRPVMEPGDALLFGGDILHRTHVTPAMTHDRTSIELRFFPADQIPRRLHGDRFMRWE